MAFERITRKEMEAITPIHHGPTKSPETQALETLSIEEGLKVPCRWKHVGYQCNGVKMLHTSARLAQIKIHARCRDGFVYVLRHA